MNTRTILCGVIAASLGFGPAAFAQASHHGPHHDGRDARHDARDTRHDVQQPPLYAFWVDYFDDAGGYLRNWKPLQ